ncbi:hypothetical protein [Microbacterium sp. NPDC056234]|uniref:hypothetical protein n=1 Tax=Microbacterium sp. NPDC056234 TaxID=3345757 RepID=UPI0035DC010B
MSAQHHDDVVTIVVVRTGGFAGLQRQWRVEAGSDDADRWLVLVDACPWDHAFHDDAGQDTTIREGSTGSDEPPVARDSGPSSPSTPEPEPTPEPSPEPSPGRSASRGADRFVWSIRARTPEQKLEQKLPEPDLVGPWRTLVDAVRSAG